jgi:hypothetical protein
MPPRPSNRTPEIPQNAELGAPASMSPILKGSDDQEWRRERDERRREGD